MKIGIDARMLGPKQTGIGNYISHLIEGIKTEQREEEFVLFLREKQRANLHKKRVSKVKAQSRWYSWGEQTYFLKKLWEQDCNLIHFPHFSHPILYSGDFVVTIHDLTPLYYPGKDTSFHRKLAYRLVLGSACKRAQKIIVPSLYTKEDVLSHFNLPGEKLEVIYEGVRLESQLEAVFSSSYSDYKQKKRHEIASRFSDFGGDEYIFYTGVWRYHKNIKGLLDAFGILRDEFGFKGKLVLAGAPKEEDEKRVEGMIKRKGLENQVLTPGFLSKADLRLFYQGASVFVLPSFYEGFGLGGLEAASQGTPVCCSNIGPLPEVMKDSALYFDPQNPEEIAVKINKILSEKQVAKKLLLRSQENLSRFSWKKMTKDTLKVYSKVLNKKV